MAQGGGAFLWHVQSGAMGVEDRASVQPRPSASGRATQRQGDGRLTSRSPPAENGRIWCPHPPALSSTEPCPRRRP